MQIFTFKKGSGTGLALVMGASATKENTMGEFIDKTKGRIKQAVGSLTGDQKLKEEGENDELKGNLKGVVKDVKDAVKDVKHSIKQATK